MNWFDVTTDEAYRKKERAKAQELKKSPWWRQKLAQGICHYCEGRFAPTDLTMDHVVPLARGGQSTKGNLVPACKDCNAKKRLATPVDMILGN
jgi:5-methylcytosine-specific restriction endonuclease McrA